MDNPKNKYKITDPEGSKLFLDAIRVVPDDGEQKAREIEDAKVKKRKRTLIITGSSVAGFIIIMSVIMYNIIQNTRSEHLKINSIISAAHLFDTKMRDGNSQINYFEDSMKEADSLLGVIDKLIIKFPEEDTLKFIWVDVLLHKYEKYIHYSLKSNMFNKIAGLDTNLLNKAKKYNPAMIDVIPLFKAIPEFYRYKRLYPDPPILATLVPQRDLIDRMIKMTKTIERTIKNDAVMIDVHYPVLDSWIDYAANYVIPEIYDWEEFWNKFDVAIDPENSKIKSETIYNDLKKRFPNVEVLKTNMNYDIDKIKEFSIGISQKSVYPPGSSLSAQWYPWVEFLRNNYGLSMNIKMYDTYNDLYAGLLNQEIDFAFLDMPVSTVSYFADAGTPVAQRLWRDQYYIENYIYTSQSGVNSPAQFKGGSAGFFANDFYEILSYFEKNNIKADLSKYKINRFTSLDSMQKAIRNLSVDILTINEEEAYYLGVENLQKAGFRNIGSTGKSPLGVLWARKGLDADFISKVQGIIIPIPASAIYKNGNLQTDYPYGNWEIYSQGAMSSYFEVIKEVMIDFNVLMNTLHVLSVNTNDDTLNVSATKKLTDYLHKEGFMVVNHNSSIPHEEEIKENEQYMTVQATDKNDKKQCEIKLFKKTKNKSNLLYHEYIEIPDSEFPPDFRHILFDLPAYITYYGKVENIKNGRISLSFSTDTKKFQNRTVKFYKSDVLGRKSELLGSGKIVSSNGIKSVVEVSTELARKISKGDIGEINNE